MILATLATVLAIAIASPAASAEKRGPSTPEEREHAVKLTRGLEQYPFHEGAKEAREWLLSWLIEIPDITVEFCGDLIGPVFKADKNYSSELFVQTIFSSAAFIIENPAQAKNREAVYQAGLEGALRMYESILKAEPQARHKFLDELIEKRDKGQLSEHIKKVMKKCK
ncbi:MAG TPA: hypothetical protein VNN18_10555 [Candidatus Xenobia bacterium]|nr:hypothetical protein [Candidatus Xenobia bacterium]